MRTPDIPNPKTIPNWPQAKRAEMLAMCEKLLQLRLEQHRLQEELMLCIIQEWNKMDEITITYDSTRSLMRAYHMAVERGAEQFTWEGKEFVTAYAKYLLEYAESRLRLDPMQKITLQRMRSTHKRIMKEKDNA